MTEQITSSQPVRPLGALTYAGVAQPWGRGAAAKNFIFTSGIDGVIAEDGSRNPDVAAQTRTVLERIERIIREAGASLEHIVQLDQYLADPVERGAYMQARDAWLSERAPALVAEQRYASLLIYPGLATPDMRVEIRAVACLPVDSK